MKIFVSYAETETEIAEKLASTLIDHGHKVLHNEQSWSKGDTRRIRFTKSIKKSNLFIFIVSPDSLKEGSETLSQLAIARSKWRSPKNRVLPVVAVTVDDHDIPAFLKAADIYRPEGELVSEISNAVYFAQKGQKAKRLGMGIIAGFLATLLTMLTIYFGINLSENDRTIVIDKESIPPEFKITPEWAMQYPGQDSIQLKLENLNPIYTPSYTCSITLPKDHRNIRNVEYDEACKNIEVFPRNTILTDSKGNPYITGSSYDEEVTLNVISDSGKLLFKSNLPIQLLENTSNLNIKGLGRYDNAGSSVPSVLQYLYSGYSIELFQDTEISINFGNDILNANYDCDITDSQLQNFSLKVVRKLDNCSFIIRLEYSLRGGQITKPSELEYKKLQHVPVTVRHVRNDWEKIAGFRLYATKPKTDNPKIEDFLVGSTKRLVSSARNTAKMELQKLMEDHAGFLRCSLGNCEIRDTRIFPAIQQILYGSSIDELSSVYNYQLTDEQIAKNELRNNYPKFYIKNCSDRLFFQIKLFDNEFTEISSISLIRPSRTKRCKSSKEEGTYLVPNNIHKSHNKYAIIIRTHSAKNREFTLTPLYLVDIPSIQYSPDGINYVGSEKNEGNYLIKMASKFKALHLKFYPPNKNGSSEYIYNVNIPQIQYLTLRDDFIRYYGNGGNPISCSNISGVIFGVRRDDANGSPMVMDGPGWLCTPPPKSFIEKNTARIEYSSDGVLLKNLLLNKRRQEPRCDHAFRMLIADEKCSKNYFSVPTDAKNIHLKFYFNDSTDAEFDLNLN